MAIYNYTFLNHPANVVCNLFVIFQFIVLCSPLKEGVVNSKPLSFESRFECGNLRKAIQVRIFYSGKHV